MSTSLFPVHIWFLYMSLNMHLWVDTQCDRCVANCFHAVKAFDGNRIEHRIERVTFQLWIEHT